MSDAFVYCWTDNETHMLYVGSHKGHPNDGYISSSKIFNAAYNDVPLHFTRSIIAFGTFPEMRKLETAILKSANAAKDEKFYNKSNGDGKFYCIGHSAETRDKMSKSWKSKGVYNCNNTLAAEASRGRLMTDEQKMHLSQLKSGHVGFWNGKRLSESHKNNVSNTRKAKFAAGLLTSPFQTNNPIKNADVQAKRKENKESIYSKVSAKLKGRTGNTSGKKCYIPSTSEKFSKTYTKYFKQGEQPIGWVMVSEFRKMINEQI